MKNEKLMPFGAVFGWFGAYLFISIVATVLPEGVDCAATLLALWGLVLICARMFEGKKSLSEILAHGGIKKVRASVLLFAFIAVIIVRTLEFKPQKVTPANPEVLVLDEDKIVTDM